MKWIKNFLREILGKIKDRIANMIATVIVVVFLIIISFIFKKYLTTVHTFTFPLWGWITIIAIIAGSLIVVFVIIKCLRKPKVAPATSIGKLLTDQGDINNKLIWWLGQQRGFVFTQTKCQRPVVWHFNRIDEENSLTPGSSKEYLYRILKSHESPFPAIVENVSDDTIRLKYDFSPYLPTAGRFP